MIDLYTWMTPNGLKVSIALEELELPYRVHSIDISKGDQFTDNFLEISPNNKIPAIVDTTTGHAMMESGAILLYLAKKAGRLMPHNEEGRLQMMQWLMWQIGHLGPMLAQSHVFSHFNKGKSLFAEDRFFREAQRLYGVLDKRLSAREYIVGDYSIVDIAAWPWISRFEWQSINLNDYPNVKRWYLCIANRPAVRRGYQIPKFVQDVPMPI